MTSTQTTTILGMALRQLRAQAGLTQAQVAARASFDAAYLSRAENGERDLRWSTVLRLVKATGADLHQFADAIAAAEKQHSSSERSRAR